MSATIMEEQLLAALREDRPLTEAGAKSERRPAGGVDVADKSGTLGTWSWRNGHFVFRPANGDDTRAHRVETIAEAVRHTHVVLEAGS